MGLLGRSSAPAPTGTRTNFETDIVLGERYRDKQTGFEGVATCVSFFQHACERVMLESYDAAKQDVKEYVFDAPRLVHVETGKQAETTKTGGPRPAAGPPRMATR
jgi:hypothetical protein